MAHSKVTPALTTVVKKKKPSNTRNGFIVKKQRKVAVFRSSLPISNHNDHLEKRSEICEPKSFPCERCNVSAFPDMTQLKLHLNHCPPTFSFRLGKYDAMQKPKNKTKTKLKDQMKIKSVEVCSIKPVSTSAVFPVENTNSLPEMTVSKNILKSYNLRRHVKLDGIQNVITVPASILSSLNSPNPPPEKVAVSLIDNTFSNQEKYNLRCRGKLSSIENVI